MRETRRGGFTVGEFLVCAVIFILLCVACYSLAGLIRDRAAEKQPGVETNAEHNSRGTGKIATFTKWAFPRDPSPGQEVTQDLGDSGVTITFCWIPGGTSRRDGRDVVVKGFWMAKYETTQAQWDATGVGKGRGCHFKGENLPVESVTFDEATAYAQKLKELSGCDVRLPTAVEWTHACCAGTPSRFLSVEDEADLGKIAWYRENSGGKTHPVGRKPANGWGLHDMVGNVEEWCSESPDDRADDRYIRGGGWNRNAEFCKATYWVHWGRSDAGYNVGFRLLAGSSKAK